MLKCPMLKVHLTGIGNLKGERGENPLYTAQHLGRNGKTLRLDPVRPRCVWASRAAPGARTLYLVP
jgi:hypothetical protein